MKTLIYVGCLGANKNYYVIPNDVVLRQNLIKPIISYRMSVHRSVPEFPTDFDGEKAGRRKPYRCVPLAITIEYKNK